MRASDGLPAPHKSHRFSAVRTSSLAGLSEVGPSASSTSTPDWPLVRLMVRPSSCPRSSNSELSGDDLPEMGVLDAAGLGRQVAWPGGSAMLFAGLRLV